MERSRVDAQLAAEAAEAKNRAAVYAQVTARDGSRCRVCDRYCDPKASTLLKKGHHHHLVYLSAGGVTTVENVILVCAADHNDEHQHRLRIEGNANEAPWLTLWKKDRLGIWGEKDSWYVWKQETGIRTYERD